MTISSEQSLTTIQGDSSSTQFSFSFVADSAADLVVSVTTNGITTPLLPTQYTVLLNPIVTGQLWSVGGVITYPLSGSPLPVGSSLTIQRIIPLQQTYSISNQGDFAPEVTEQGLDSLLMQLQQISARGGAFRGVWQVNTAYNYADIVQDGVNGSDSGNYYLCAIANTSSSSWTTDLAAGDWVLIIISAFPTTPLPLSVSNGGTGQVTAAAALTALGGVGLSSANTFTAANNFTGGSATVPTRSPGDSSNNAASTAFVNTTALTLTNGTTATTQSIGDNSTKVATTAFVLTNAAGAPLNSPAFTGTPTAPTAATGTQTTQLATTSFANPAFNASGNGYVKLPSGIIFQWGTGNTSSSNPATVTFPIAFPNNCFSITATVSGVSDGKRSAGIGTFSTSSATVYTGEGSGGNEPFNFNWLAVGN